MFDGNFRARREIDYSGNRRRQRGAASSGPRNKQQLLKNAEMQRRQRQEQLRKDRAARKIQKTARGHLGRVHIAAELVSRRSDQQPYPNNTLAILSILLSPQFSSIPFCQQRQEILQDYAKYISSNPKASTADRWYSERRLFLSTLTVFQPDKAGADMEILFTILETYIQSGKRVDTKVLLDLVDCARRWWDACFSSHGANSTSQTEVVKTLCQWCFIVSQRILGESNFNNPKLKELHRALLGSIFLETQGIFRSGSDAARLLPQAFQSDDYYSDWLLPLVHIYEATKDINLDLSDNTETNMEIDLTPAEDSLMNAIRRNLEANRNSVLLNALDLSQHPSAKQHPHTLIHLLEEFLQQTPDLELATSLAVLGDDLSKPVAPMASNEVTDGDAQVSDSDEEDEDEEMNGERMTSGIDGRSNSKKPRKVSSRYSRQELSTVAKLDRKYQASVEGARQAISSSLSAQQVPEDMLSNLRTARYIAGNANMWLEWGLVVLGGDNDDLNKVAHKYVSLLATLLQATTSLRTKSKVAMSSSILSRLAFNHTFLEKLWRYAEQLANQLEASKSIGSFISAREKNMNLAFLAFCEVFNQYLISLSDVDFVDLHTNLSFESTSSPKKSSISVIDVISRIKSILHGLYWTKPVLAGDFDISSPEKARGRLLISGTRLWNSLYERWNRLVRKFPFAEESIWWFPYLSTSDGDTAVISSRDNQIDEDGDVDEMETDEDDRVEGVSMQMSEADSEADALAGSFRDPKMARVLTSIPQALPFDRRVKLFSSLLVADKLRTQDESSEARRAILSMMRGEDDGAFGSIREKVEIHRDRIYEDSRSQLNQLGPKLKRKVQVSFINQHNQQEAGIDGGGVFKEFLDDLIKTAFVPDPETQKEQPKLFTATPLQTLTVNPDLSHDAYMLGHYEFLGRVLGKAVYESILVEPQFCLPFLNQLLGKVNSLEDLKNLDYEFYRNLVSLRNLKAEEINELGLTFELVIGENTSSTRTVELLPGGRNKAVTKENVVQYIHMVSHYRLNVQGYHQTKAFLRGFRDLIPASWVRLFSAIELQKVIGGDDSIRGIDVAALKKSMQYAAGYHPSQPIMIDFWDILENEFSPEQQRKFLKFMTSCSRQPLLGFASLEPAPCIQQIRLPEDADVSSSRLPTSSTCMNLLKLPNYRDRAVLRQKLLAAIESGSGFELT